MKITLEEAKNYLRVTFDEDDAYINSLIDVADAYLEGGITGYKEKLKNKKFAAKAKMASLILISNLYDERYIVGQEMELSYTFIALVTQLEYFKVGEENA